jgi:hypothetical protein
MYQEITSLLEPAMTAFGTPIYMGQEVLAAQSKLQQKCRPRLPTLMQDGTLWLIGSSVMKAGYLS